MSSAPARHDPGEPAGAGDAFNSALVDLDTRSMGSPRNSMPKPFRRLLPRLSSNRGRGWFANGMAALTPSSSSRTGSSIRAAAIPRSAGLRP